MTRLLVPTTAGPAGDDKEDGFLSRLAKFIPSETGTLYTVATAYLLDEATRVAPVDGQPNVKIIAGLPVGAWTWIILIVCFVGNTILLNRMYDVAFLSSPQKGVLKVKHIFASSVGFLVWVYAIKAPVCAAYYHGFIAFLLIGFFLIIVANIKAPQA